MVMKDKEFFKDHVVYEPKEVKEMKTKMVPKEKVVSKVVQLKRTVMKPVASHEEKTIMETKTVMKDVVKDVKKTKMVPKTVMKDRIKWEQNHVMTKAWQYVDKEVMVQKSVPVYSDDNKIVTYKNVQVPQIVKIAKGYFVASPSFVPISYQEAVIVHTPVEYVEKITVQKPHEIQVPKKIQVPVTKYVAHVITEPHVI